jgi:hypothetical protein
MIHTVCGGVITWREAPLEAWPRIRARIPRCAACGVDVAEEALEADPEPRYSVIPEFNFHGGAGWAVFDRVRQAPTGGWFADRIAAERTAAVLEEDRT